MSKRRFGFEGFSVGRQQQQSSSISSSAPPAPRRPSAASPSHRPAHDNYEDHDVDEIEYENQEEDEDEREPSSRNPKPTSDEDIDPLDAFMAGIHDEVKNAPVNPKPRAKVEQLENEEDDPMESFLSARRDAGLTLAAEALHAGYDSDEEVYAAAKAVDAGLVEYDSDDNLVVTADKRKIEPLAPLDHGDIDYEPFTKDFYEEKPSISGVHNWLSHKFLPCFLILKVSCCLLV